MTWDKLLKLAMKYECARVEYENDPHGGENYAAYLFAASVLARAFCEWAREHPTFSASFAVGDRIDERMKKRAALKSPTPRSRASRKKATKR